MIRILSLRLIVQEPVGVVDYRAERVKYKACFSISERVKGEMSKAHYKPCWRASATIGGKLSSLKV
ncbi:MAG TPA: hypothetical protein VJJ27_01400 [Candidatus Paceibacterota bacterium]